MQELAEAGIATVPTWWLERQDAVEVKRYLEDRLKDEPSGKIVIKPAVGLATHGVMMAQKLDLEAACRHTKELLSKGDVMIQPFIKSVREAGERALVFINGNYCHAVRKSAFQELKPAGLAGEMPVVADKDEIALALKAMSFIVKTVNGETGGKPPLFARVDLVRSESGTPLIIEVELVEPSLFLGFYPDSVEKFADAIEASLSL
jgi:glutathione synthase/RimK-type ligase-like ATP-grasp enzyme